MEKDFTVDQRVQVMTRCFDIMEEVLSEKKYSSKKEVLEQMKNRALKLDKGGPVPEVEKLAVMEAYKKLDGLTFAEIQEIIDIIKEP